MRHCILTLLITVISALGLYAQEREGSKILVFRNTGEINIFNSDSISKVELSVFDTDSIAHDEFVSQVFHHKNATTVAIPLAEIDSVAFGYRNIIEPKKGVRRLTDEEAEAISSFEGKTLLYDSRLALREGEIVYYDCITDILPIGLCIKVNKVTYDNNGHKAEVSICDPKDVFDRYLMTGDSQTGRSNAMKKADDYDNEILRISLPEYDNNGVKIEGSAKFAFHAELQNIVRDLINDYYHAEIKLSAIPKIEFSATSEDGDLVNLDLPESQKIRKSIPFLLGTLKLDFVIDAFFDIMAEAGVKYELEQEHSVIIEWTKDKGNTTFGKPVAQSQQLNEATQKIEVHLNGEIFLGLKFDIGINTALDIAGAGIEVKAGPKLEAEFSLGAINQLSEQYDEEVYGKANIYLKGGVKIDTYEQHRTWVNPFVIVRNKLPFDAEFFAELDTIRLFPEFNSKAVLARAIAPIVQTGREPEAVSISTFIEDDLPYPLDISFEIADKNTEETLAETEVIDTLESETEDFQTIYTDIVIPTTLGKVDKNTIVARPVINYKGYKVKTQPASVAGDMVLTPSICSLTEGGVHFVSGMTPVSQRNFGEATYMEGNLVGVIKGDPRHHKRKFKMYEFIDISNPDECTGTTGATFSLLGGWAGSIAGENVRFTFTDSQRGYYNDIPFTYKCNSPQLGGIAIILEDGGRISFSVIDISVDSMTILMKATEEKAILYRQ